MICQLAPHSMTLNISWPRFQEHAIIRRWLSQKLRITRPTQRCNFEWSWATLSKSKTFNDMERRAAFMRQPSFLFSKCCALSVLVFIARQHTDSRYWYSNSVRPSVCLSVAFWYSVETAWRIVIISLPHDSAIVLWESNIFAKFQRGHPLPQR